MQRHLGQLSNGLQQRQGHLGANHGSRLQEALGLGREPIDTRRKDRLHRGGHLHGQQGGCQAIGTRLPDEGPSLHQGAHTLL